MSRWIKLGLFAGLTLVTTGCGSSGSESDTLRRDQSLNRFPALCTSLCAQEERCFDEDRLACEQDCRSTHQFLRANVARHPWDEACLDRLIRLGRCVNKLSCRKLENYYSELPSWHNYPCHGAEGRMNDVCDGLDWWEEL